MAKVLSAVLLSGLVFILSITSASASAILEFSSASKNFATRNVAEAYLYVENVSEPNPLLESGKYEVVVRILGTKPVLINPNMPEQGYYEDKIAQYKGAKIKALTSMRIAGLTERELMQTSGKNVKAYMIMNNEDSFVIKKIQVLPDSWTIKELEAASTPANASAAVDKDAGIVLH